MIVVSLTPTGAGSRVQVKRGRETSGSQRVYEGAAHVKASHGALGPEQQVLKSEKTGGSVHHSVHLETMPM